MFDKAFIDELAEAVASKLEARLKGAAVIGKRLLTVREAAVYLGRTEAAVYNLIAKRKISFVKEGQRVHIDRDDLERFVEQGRAA